MSHTPQEADHLEAAATVPFEAMYKHKFSIEALIDQMKRLGGVPVISDELEGRAVKAVRLLVDSIYAVNFPTYYTPLKVLDAVWTTIREGLPIEYTKADEKQIYAYLHAMAIKPEFTLALWQDEVTVKLARGHAKTSLSALLVKPEDRTA